MTTQTEARLTGLLGISMRAGLISSGQEQCVAVIRAGNAAVAFMDADASENTKKRMRDACAAHTVPLCELRAGALGRSIGKRERVTAAIGDCGLAKSMLTLLDGDNDDNGNL